MNIETIKLPVKALAKGMVVVKLDRPWLETPFKLQGFRIEKNAELKMLASYCEYVYVDVERGTAPARGIGERVLLTVDEDSSDEAAAAQAFLRDGKGRGKRVSAAARDPRLPAPLTNYAIEQDFDVELPAAMAALAAAKETLRGLVRNLDSGSADLESVREAAFELEASILRNPDPALLIRALRDDEPFSFRHSVHSAVLAIALARELGFRRQAIHELTMGVLLADIGKTRLPSALLRAARRLEAAEAEVLRQHVDYGVEIARSFDGLTPGTIGIIAAHHERFNGSGYPAGLRGGEIPLPARIAGLVDSVDALTSMRVYAEPIAMHEAVQELYAATTDVFQRELVEKLIQILGTYPTGSWARLSDNTLAIVVAQNPHRRLLPILIRMNDAGSRGARLGDVVDLSQTDAPPLAVKQLLDPLEEGRARPAAGAVLDAVIRARAGRTRRE
ncbi:MAG: HD domain-containing phosphohydrolase [Gammaproteobacteria bacterium]